MQRSITGTEDKVQSLKRKLHGREEEIKEFDKMRKCARNEGD